MCISRVCLRCQWGFTLVELLVGVALTLIVSVIALTLWGSVESAGVAHADRAVRLIQGRVAIARFERDLRSASAVECPFSVEGSLLQASPTQVVFLTRSEAVSGPVLVEWEIVGQSLMRRRGTCPLTRPITFPHTLYVDNKTMLEGVGPGSHFSYLSQGGEVTSPVPVDDLPRVDEVKLVGGAKVPDMSMTVDIVGGATVGR